MFINSEPVISCQEEAINNSQRIVDSAPLSSSKEILEELKRVLEQEKCKDESAVSIYDLLRLFREKNSEIVSLDNQLFQYIKNNLEEEIFAYGTLFDQEEMKLIIIYNDKKIFFTKRDGNLVISKTNCRCANELLVKCGKEISERYDKFVRDIGFYRDGIDNVKAVNSNFVINSGEFNISISEKNVWSSSFALSARIQKNQYDYKCDSNNVIAACQNNEDEIFKRIFVRIADCPKWTQQTLYQMRQEQLERQEEMRNKVIEIPKRLEQVRKLNLFHKK